MKAPSFWQERGTTASLLAPVAWIYDQIARRRFVKIPNERARLPIICVGNFTAGGAGKTPCVIALARSLASRGEKPFVVTKGYGGRTAGPILVDPSEHHADDVGDEPLLIARSVPTVMCKSRARGAAFAAHKGASLIILDDGFQSPDIYKDVSIVVVDGETGVGNGRVMPAGPLRLSLKWQKTRADHILIVGHDKHESLDEFGIKGWQASLEAKTDHLPQWKSWYVFAGIGRPEKFFKTARAAGLDIAEVRAFPDHHRYTEKDAIALEEAFDSGLGLLTTAKDAVKFRGDEALSALAPKLHVIEVEMKLPETLVDAVLAQCRAASTALREATAST